eukprot:RCo051141
MAEPLCSFKRVSSSGEETAQPTLEPISRAAIALAVSTAASEEGSGGASVPKPGVPLPLNAAAVLNEYAQRCKAPEPPRFTVVHASPAGGVVVQLVVDIGGTRHEEVCTSRDKKMAKQQASEALLQKLLPGQTLEQIVELMRIPAPTTATTGPPG